MGIFSVRLCKGLWIFLMIVQVKANQCDGNCELCANINGVSRCTKCGDGYWLLDSACQPCSINCATCSNISSCETCKPGFHSLKMKCDSQCSANCLDGLCYEITGHCNQCPSNRYGYYCDFDCGLCKNEECVLRKCTDGCKAGYWQYQGGNTLECKPCMDNCSSCDNGSVCNICNDGTFLHAITNDRIICAGCSPNCELCSSLTKCSSCKPGYFGLTCEYNCTTQIPYCYMCDWKGETTVACNQCDNGYSLQDNRCIHNLECPLNCERCTSSNVCESCKTGWYGELCDISCRNISNCVACQQLNDSVLCTVCNEGYIVMNGECMETSTEPTSTTGADCTDIPSCKSCSKVNTSIVCSLCDEGYEVMKGNCRRITSQQTTTSSTHITTKLDCKYITNCFSCFETNGTISCSQCLERYTIKDGMCKQTTPRPITSTSSSSTLTTEKQPGQTSEQSDNKPVLIGAVAGGVGLILVVVVLIIVCFKKRKSKDRNANNQHAEAINGCPAEEDLADYPVYAQPNKVKTTQQPEDYLYAQPIKLKKSNKQIGESQQSTNSDGATSLDLETVIVESDVDRHQLETLDGEMTSDIEMGEDIPSSDTYYNVEGLLRSRVQVSNLLEYVKKKNDYDTEFKKLPKGLQRSCNEALKVRNRTKNRFNGIYAYDATRVELRSKSYINANYIDGYNQSKAYIASLGPTADTMNAFSTFWEMVWQDRVDAIVMLTNLEEGGKMKCEQYWPNPGSRKTCHDYNVKCVAEHIYAEFTVRELILQMIGTSQRRDVIQYHYTAWPDRFVPDTVASLVQFRDKVESVKRHTNSPLVVHCSAGIGRTGTYIALDMLIKEGRDSNYVDLFGCALGLRGQRVHLIQNEVQYEYLHHAVLYSLTCDTEPLSTTAVKKLTDQRISNQFKVLTSLPAPSKRLSSWSSNYEDRAENRPGSDIPSERYRVRLQFSIDDYINAVYVNGYLRRDAFIAAQTPMPSTVEDFLSMVYHERCSCIVGLDEEDKTNQSVVQYLPAVKDSSIVGQYQIRCNDIKPYDDFMVRDITINSIGSPLSEQLNIRHFQLKNWKKDEIVPNSTKSFLNLVKKVATSIHTQTSSGPAALHCLTGSLRCGIFLAVSTMMEKLVIDKHVSGVHTVCHIRKRRHTALQKPEMLKFCYHCVADSIHSSINKDDYYNVINLRH